MTEIFDRIDFENALPKHNRTGAPMWTSRGLDCGEYTYLLPISEHAAVMIRSSVKQDGWSAERGKDSIRLWLMNPKTGVPVSNKLKTEFIKRTTGWQERLVNQLRMYYQLGRFVRPCSCGRKVWVGQSHKENEMKNYMYATCGNFDCKGTGFRWVMDPKGNPIQPKVTPGQIAGEVAAIRILRQVAA